MPVDFVPDPCEGTNIFQCFTLKNCNLDALVEDLTNPVGDISAGTDLSIGRLVDIQAELNACDTCIVAAVTAAFAIAGEPLPVIPPNPPIPDFSSLQDDLTDIETEITDQLGYLQSTFTLEDDGTKITRIISA